MVRATPVAIGWLLVVALLGGCSTATGPAGYPKPPCADAARATASAHPSSVRETALDPMIWACSSLVDFEAAVSVYSVAVDGGDSLAAATTRCGDPQGPRDAALCQTLLATPSG